MDYMEPISTSLLSNNSCYLIAREMVDGHLLPISTSTNIFSNITRRKVYGIKIYMVTTSVVT